VILLGGNKAMMVTGVTNTEGELQLISSMLPAALPAPVRRLKKASKISIAAKLRWQKRHAQLLLEKQAAASLK
jgi:hypothetical protein